MTDLEHMIDILTRGNIQYTVRGWHSKETGSTGKFIEIRQGDYNVYIEFDSDGKVLENYD